MAGELTEEEKRDLDYIQEMWDKEDAEKSAAVSSAAASSAAAAAAPKTPTRSQQRMNRGDQPRPGRGAVSGPWNQWDNYELNKERRDSVHTKRPRGFVIRKNPDDAKIFRHKFNLPEPSAPIHPEESYTTVQAQQLRHVTPSQLDNNQNTVMGIPAQTIRGIPVNNTSSSSSSSSSYGGRKRKTRRKKRRKTKKKSKRKKRKSNRKTRRKTRRRQKNNRKTRGKRR